MREGSSMRAIGIQTPRTIWRGRWLSTSPCFLVSVPAGTSFPIALAVEGRVEPHGSNPLHDRKVYARLHCMPRSSVG